MTHDDEYEVPVGERPSARSSRVGAALRRFDAIRLDYGPATYAVEVMNTLRHSYSGVDANAPRGGAFIVAPPGTGKSETFKLFERTMNAEAPDGARPVLRVVIDTSGTTDSVPTAVLKALGARRPDAGKETVRWDRATDEMRRQGVEIALFDEFNRAARRPTMSAAIASAIQQHVMDAGIAPIVVAGTAAASRVLKGSPGFEERLDESIDLSPMRWGRPGDPKLLTDFLKRLGERLLAERLVRSCPKLHEGDVPKLLCEATDGRIRAVMKTVRHALRLAQSRDAPTIDRADLAEAVENYCKRCRLTKVNPFVAGDAATPAGKPDGEGADGSEDADAEENA